MHLILLALGIAAIGAGGGMLGYGIPINEFGLGNTLILAGTTAIAGGLIVVALSVAVRQLTRIAARLEASEPAAMPAATAEAPQRGWADPIPVAVVPVPAAQPPRGPPAGEEQTDAPKPPDYPPPPREPAPREQPTLPRVATRTRGKEAGAAGNSGAEPIGAAMRLARTQRGEIPLVLSPRERGIDRPSEPAPAGRREIARLEDRSSGAPRAQAAVSILKSGVIDGMAYTIYSDGSIEAELPKGTMRFTTFDELRVYLADAS